MDGTGNPQGGGTPPDPAAGQPGAGGGGDGGAGAGGAGASGKPGTEGAGGEQAFDRAKLHPALRDMTPEQITNLFEDMANGLRARPTAPPADGGEQSLGLPGRVPPKPREEPTKLSKEQLKEYFDPNSEKFDPGAAVVALGQENFGNLLGDINRRSITGLFGTFRSDIPDFKDYEADIQTALQGRDPASITERDVLGVYLQAKGLRHTLKERADRAAKSATTLAPTPDPKDKKPESEPLSALEEQVADRMFREEESSEKRRVKYKEWRDRDEKGDLTMKVPVGGGKKV